MKPITAPKASSQAGQEQLLHVLVADHGKALLAYAEKLLSDRQLAEDVVQETMIRAWRHTERLYSTDGSVRGWLLTVARNLIIDRMRSAPHRYETVGTDNQDMAQRDHADSVLASVDATYLLRQLSVEHREVLVHTYLCGRTVQETAGILGIPPGTVKSRQHYALTNLRRRVQGAN
ncbi:sigma-70 family RNA polymerase sigma factor [Streptomyces sp. SID3212]|uniref:sigma-70 family RNA polymerase sigma factor n=1 Tax=unclassified Streptomyces TaxID=2593676 RepID=UPI001369F763|nr:sigma-70 family RNA polymerase sigma factor [Streptomyces sp. SID3212]MYV51593.1 sigma-70 family RNA polymerase sigma factor [Streptomyces sp. SID3212]